MEQPIFPAECPFKNNFDFRWDGSGGSGPPWQDPNKEAGDFGDPLGLGQYNEEFRNKAQSLGFQSGGIPTRCGMSKGNSAESIDE